MTNNFLILTHLLQPLTLVRVTKAHSFKSEEVCSKTLKRRVCEVQGVRSLLSPERPEKILEEEIRALGSEEKKMIQTEAGLTLDIEATTGLGMKAAQLACLGTNLGL